MALGGLLSGVLRLALGGVCAEIGAGGGRRGHIGSSSNVYLNQLPKNTMGLIAQGGDVPAGKTKDPNGAQK